MSSPPFYVKKTIPTSKVTSHSPLKTSFSLFSPSSLQPKFDNFDIKNETFNSFPELIICQICQCIMLEPVMCLNCQNYYCKKCIEDWKKKSPTCPNKCEEPIFKNVIEKNRLITKMKFKCIYIKK